MIIASWWPNLRSWPWSTNVATQAEKPINGRPLPTKTPRPNYSKIHAYPLPVIAHPLPLLVPHNPLSVLHIIAICIGQVFAPPRSHPEQRYQALWSATTGTVHVADEGTMRALWEKGFFGKGSLSRSEPTWLEREKKKLGVTAADTSEQYTRQRREERKQFKNERAKKEREAIEEKLRQEMEGTSNGAADLVNEEQEEDEEHLGELHTTSSTVVGSETLAEPVAEAVLDATLDAEASIVTEKSAKTSVRISRTPPESVINTSNLPTPSIPKREHLQLTAEETLFLVYALGVLDVCTPSSPDPICTSDLLALFCARSRFPPATDRRFSPSNPFLVSYAVYHHFRSLGWVVRPGIKFGVDYLLYQRGPAFAHAQFSVIVVPSYGHAYWKGRNEVEKSPRKSWWWLHAVNRVQSQVLKNLVVAFVEVPPPEAGQEDSDVIDMTRLLRGYKIREMVIKRWTPNRTRD